MAKMFKFFKRHTSGNLDNSSDIVTDQTAINVSDSAPILTRNHFDLSQSTNSVHHDLRHATVTDVSLVKRSLRTIPGVFCPVALSMCSVAVFMRIGFIVGNAGVLQSIGLYFLAFTIFVLTGLSVCAISTNGAIQGGGVYYMISRALGPEFGGSIGTLFFFANAIGSSFNAAGLVEALLNNFGSKNFSGSGGLPDSWWWRLLYGTVLNIITLIISLLGANLFSYAVTFIYLIMLVAYTTVIFSIFIRGRTQIVLNNTVNYTEVAYFTGFSSQTFQNNLYANYTRDSDTEKQTNFAFVFGVLFSSLTGIMAGANMSGELKKPSKSIPVGTMSAVVFVFCVYFLENLLLAASCEQKYDVLQDITYGGKVLIPMGILATTFSGELSALIGSSRVLKALADDEIFGPVLNFVKFGKTKSGNPWVAVLITFCISELVLCVGKLNAIASLVTIFYLLAYFGVNLACLALDLASAPNFRPTFKYFSWHTALVGMVASIAMTFIVSLEYAAIAISLLIALIIVLYFRDFPPEWGSISQALIFHQVRKYLLMLDTRKDHVKFWRPQILLLISNPRSCLPLIDFGNDVKKGGLFVLGNVKLGQLDSFEEDPCIKEMPAWMNLVDNLRVKAFVELTLNSSIKEGIHNLIRISGLGGMKPNTVMLGFYDNILPEDMLKNTLFRKKRRLLNYGLTSSTSNGTLSQNGSVYQFDDIRSSNDTENRLELDDYVDVVRDILKMKKNLCICRQLNTLSKIQLKASSAPIYIDVWPLNFLIPELSTQLDSTCLFMLQLACILNMVSVWKRATVRVFLCTESSDAAENARRKSRLDDLLTQLRIHATSFLVQMEHVKILLNRPTINEADLIHYQLSTTSPEILNVSDIYLKAVNQLIKEQSVNSALCFLYLPPPPPLQRPNTNTSLFSNIASEKIASASTPNTSGLQDNIPLESSAALISTTQHNETNQKYIRMLEILSDSLPPCIYVNGVSCVTSTHL